MDNAMPTTWILMHAKGRYEKINVGPTEASFPLNTLPAGLTEYILLKTSVGEVPLCVKKRFGASGNVIFVARDTLKDVHENEAVSFEPTSKIQYGLFWFLRRRFV